jgi:hypothetical protein
MYTGNTVKLAEINRLYRDYRNIYIVSAEYLGITRKILGIL